MNIQDSTYFSIAIPAYKAKFLKNCINSILEQTYTNFELIIVNDASPENLDEIVNKFNDSRIKYYTNKKNTGAENVVDNWNICLSYASGEYFILMGDDDEMESDYLSEFVDLINKYPGLDVYHCRSFIINEKSERVLVTQSRAEWESIYENIWHRINYFRWQYISDFVYRRDSLIAEGGFFKLPLAWASDDISAYIAMKEKGIAHTNKPVFRYRRSSITLSSGGNPELKMMATLLEENWLQNFIKNNKPESEIDKAIAINLNEDINRYIIKKKLDIIKKSLNVNTRKSVYFWLKNAKKYNINRLLVGYALIEKVKHKKAKKNIES